MLGIAKKIRKLFMFLDKSDLRRYQHLLYLPFTFTNYITLAFYLVRMQGLKGFI